MGNIVTNTQIFEYSLINVTSEINHGIQGMKSTILFIFNIFFSGFVYAQGHYTTTNTEAIKYYAQGTSSFDNNDFDGAITLLLKAIEIDSTFIEAHVRLADTYDALKQYKPAAEQYRAALNINPVYSRRVYLKLGQIEVNIAQYASSEQHLQKYLTYPGITDEDVYKAKKLLKDDEFSIEAIKHPVPFTPINMGPAINTADDEYLPVATADESTLIFTRKIDNNEDFYKSVKVDGKWQPATYLSSNINTPNYNEGAQSISADGKYLFFTGCNRPDGLGRCDIYVAQKKAMTGVNLTICSRR